MRNLKKFLALVLAMVMAFSLMVTANASHAGTQYGDEADVTPAFSEAVEVLTGMGIFQGDNGDFRPASNITRAEVAAIIYRLATGDTGTAKMDLYTTRHPFTDVRADAWYAGYVGYLYNAKIIKGTTATTFNPAGNVTGYEVLAMILRAVGYDKNDEFTGGTWRVEVGSTATTLGILKDVDSTHYGDTLNLASRRDVVASMLFRTAAYVPMVQYTLAFGYQDTGMEGGVTGSKKNPTLGYKYFGLTERTGAVVGNQATGESYTLLSSTATAAEFNTAGGVTAFWYDDVVNYKHTTDNTSVVQGSPTGDLMLSFNFNTGLDFFGHKATVWYDYRTASGSVPFGNANGVVNTPSAFRTTYAVVDKANLVKTVWADNLKVNGSTAGATSIYTAAVAAGFSQYSNPGVESDRYAQLTPIAAATATQSKVGMYKIISNNASLKADVVIALNQEVAQINQVNTTIKNGEYIYLGTGTSQFGDVLSGGSKGLILFDQLSDASVKTLGTVVTAHQIVGTAYGAATCNDYGTTPGGTPYRDSTGTPITTATVNTEDMLYQTDKLEPGLTGTIATYKQAGPATTDNVTAVTLTDGTVLNLSGITGSLSPFGFDGYQHLINGVNKLVNNNTYAGVTYTFYFDEVGRFIGVGAPNEYKFVYTTFADYQIGNLGTGTIGYYIYGVDWNGEIVKDKQIISITEPVDSTSDPTTLAFDGLTNAGVQTTYRGGNLAVGYNLLPVTMKDQGAALIGNRIRGGSNTRFVVDPAGHMSWFNDSRDYGHRFLGFWDTNANGGAGDDSYTWTITAQDAANGFVRVYNHDVTVPASGTPAVTAPNTVAPASTADNTDYLLTDTTKFIVVTGSGTADLAVKTYNGIGDLVGNNSYAEISIDDDYLGDNVYFLTNADLYGNVDVENNRIINTVILSDTNLNNFTTQSLFFSEPGNQATGVKLAGNSSSTINQYKLYNNGQVGYYWVDDNVSIDRAGTKTANGTAAEGDFYTLTPIDVVNGQTIYKATVQAYGLTGRICDVNELYDYIMVNDLSTAAFGGTAAAGHPGNVVKKVGGANVTVALGDNYNGAFVALFPNGININDIQTLNNAVSMGKAGTSGNLYDIKVAFEYSGVEVTNIYVTAVTATP